MENGTIDCDVCDAVLGSQDSERERERVREWAQYEAAHNYTAKTKMNERAKEDSERGAGKKDAKQHIYV